MGEGQRCVCETVVGAHVRIWRVEDGVWTWTVHVEELLAGDGEGG